MYTQVYHGAMQKYLIFDLAKYLKIPIRYCFLEIVSKIKIKILRPLYLLYLSLLYLRYSPTLNFVFILTFNQDPCHRHLSSPGYNEEGVQGPGQEDLVHDPQGG